MSQAYHNNNSTESLTNASAFPEDSPSVFVPAIDLRSVDTLRQIPNKPGWYRWWAPESITEL
jgi:hypothetical protein